MAKISGSNPITTAFQALKLAFVGFIVPFMIVYNPSLTLVEEFEIFPFIWAIFRLGLSLWVMTTALGGVATHKLSWFSRLLRLILGVFILLSQEEFQILGLSGILLLFSYEFIRAHKAKKGVR